LRSNWDKLDLGEDVKNVIDAKELVSAITERFTTWVEAYGGNLIDEDNLDDDS